MAGAASANPYQYTGRENDGTGLYFYRARYYSSMFGRFVSQDPIALAGGANLYAYVGGSPTQHADPFGLHKKDPNTDNPPRDPSAKKIEKEFRPHATPQNCRVLEGLRLAQEILGGAETALGFETGELSGPGEAANGLFPARIVNDTLLKGVARCN